jgi:putative transposase
MTKFLNTYRVESNRLKGFDYGSNGHYFITVCTHKKNDYFGTFIPGVETDYNPSLQLFEMGIKAKECWEEIPIHFPFVKLGDFVVMPDHIHGIINIDHPDKKDFAPNSFSSPKQNLGSIIRSYKGAVQRYATRNNIEFKWQRGYHDRIVRNINSLTNISNYVKNNPVR